MSSGQGPFSERNGYERPDEVLYRGELPLAVRAPMLEILQWYADPEFLWKRIEILAHRYGAGKLLRDSCPIRTAGAEDSSALKIRGFLVLCPWFYIYDLVEDIYSQLSSGAGTAGLGVGADAGADAFQRDINDYLLQAGVGWQLVDGRCEVRGAEDLKGVIGTAGAELRTHRRDTAAQHIDAAWQALSQRPEPDLLGAIDHAMQAFECVARELSGEPRASMEEVLRHRPGLLPRPIENAMIQLWSYASRLALAWGRGEKQAWYFEDFGGPTREDAEMVVTLAATITTYMTRRHRNRSS